MAATGYRPWPMRTSLSRFGLDDLAKAITAIEEIMKRHTGEIPIRPFVRWNPPQAILRAGGRVCSQNHHMRHVASEGSWLRLSWAWKFTLIVALARCQRESPESILTSLSSR